MMHRQTSVLNRLPQYFLASPHRPTSKVDAAFFFLETYCLSYTRSSAFIFPRFLYCIDERDLFETERNPTGNLAWELHRSNLLVDFNCKAELVVLNCLSRDLNSSVSSVRIQNCSCFIFKKKSIGLQPCFRHFVILQVR